MKFVNFMKLVVAILTLSVKAPVLFSYQIFKWLRKIDAHKVFQCFIVQEVMLLVIMLAFIASPYYEVVGLTVFIITILFVAPVGLFFMTGQKTSGDAWSYIIKGDKERYEEKFNRQMTRINKLSSDKHDCGNVVSDGDDEDKVQKKESAQEIQERIARKVAEEQKVSSGHGIVSDKSIEFAKPKEETDKLSDADIELIDSEMDALFGNLDDTDDTPVPEVPEVTEEVITTTDDEKVNAVAGVVESDIHENDEIDVYVPTAEDSIIPTIIEEPIGESRNLNDFIDDESIKDANSGDVDKRYNNNVSESAGYGMLSGSSDDDDDEEV